MANDGTPGGPPLSSWADPADHDVDTYVNLLDGIDGAWARTQLAREQAAAGDTIALDQL